MQLTFFLLRGLGIFRGDLWFEGKANYRALQLSQRDHFEIPNFYKKIKEEKLFFCTEGLIYLRC